MHLKALNLQNFRNYPALSLSLPPEGALFEGLNGAGKTNILEAIHILCTGRSQRGASRGDMISHGQEAAFLEGVFCNIPIIPIPDNPNIPIIPIPDNPNIPNIPIIPDIPNIPITPTNPTTTASIGFSRDKKISMKINGNPIPTYSDWFGHRPIVSFGADDLALVYGAPELRRRFLDMLLSQIDRPYLAALSAYRRAMACRNALFGQSRDAAQFEVYELSMAEAGALIVSTRADAVEELRGDTGEIYGSICSQTEAAGVEYLQKFKCDFSCARDWQNIYLNSLAERRDRDAELAYTGVGPHRDDLRLTLGGRAAKACASQGQCRSFALALKLAAVRMIERRIGGTGMIFLVDDAVSELDEERTSRVYPLIEGRGQIFVATPKCQAVLGDGIMRCTVEDGRVVGTGG